MFRAVIAAVVAATMCAAPAFADEKPSVDNKTAQELIAEDPQFESYLEESRHEEDLLQQLGETDAQPGIGTDRTANPDPTYDQRLGVLWWRTKEGLFSNTSTRYCTAEHIGGRWWITARHCVPGYRFGFIETSEGSFAGVERWWFAPDKRDVALLRMGTGLTANPAFSVANRTLTTGEEFTITGFAGVHRFASSSQFKKLSEEKSVYYKKSDETFNHPTRSGLAPGEKYRTLGGDSGGACYKGNTLYAVHSGSNDVPQSYDTELSPILYWIHLVQNENSSSQAGDIWDAYHGGRAAKDDRRSGKTIHQNNYVSGSHSGYGSS